MLFPGISLKLSSSLSTDQIARKEEFQPPTTSFFSFLLSSFFFLLLLLLFLTGLHIQFFQLALLLSLSWILQPSRFICSRATERSKALETTRRSPGFLNGRLYVIPPLNCTWSCYVSAAESAFLPPLYEGFSESHLDAIPKIMWAAQFYNFASFQK